MDISIESGDAIISSALMLLNPAKLIDATHLVKHVKTDTYGSLFSITTYVALNSGVYTVVLNANDTTTTTVYSPRVSFKRVCDV